MFLSKFFKRFTSDKKGSSASDGSPEHTFAVRHHRFKLFLTGLEQIPGEHDLTGIYPVL